MATPNPIVFVAVLFAGLLVSTALPAQEAGDTVIKQGPVKDDLYLAGGTVEVRARAEGDVVVAGGTVTIADSVRGDVLVAGGTVRVTATVEDDVRAVGGQVEIDGTVRDDVLAAGGTVTLTPATTVGGRAWLAGATVNVGGKIGKGLKAAGEHIVIRAEIGGDAELAGEHIEIGPGAVIRGQLRYLSRNAAQIDRGARIDGSVTRMEFEHAAAPRAPAAGVRFGGFVMLGVAAIVFYLLWPGFSVEAAGTLRRAPGKSLAYGLASFATLPVVIVLLLITIIGVLLALPLMALYPVLLLTGLLTAIIFLSDLGLRRLGRADSASRGQRVAAIAVTLLVLWLLCFLPGIGALVMFALMVLGLGALVQTLWRRYSGPA